MERSAVIKAAGLAKKYVSGEIPVYALSDVNLTICRGEMAAIMGPSGCGKTTLLNCLSGLDRFDDGEVWVDGQSLRRLSDNALSDYRARRMGFVFQAYNLISVLTSVENVEMPLMAVGLVPSEARRRATEVLTRLGLENHLHRFPAQMSGGQRQRVAVARALVNQPAILWADEPTGALDSTTAFETMNLIREVNATLGQTVVIVTHDPQVAAQTHRIVHMRDGRIETDREVTDE